VAEVFRHMGRVFPAGGLLSPMMAGVIAFSARRIFLRM